MSSCTWPVGRYQLCKGARSHVVELLAAGEVRGLCRLSCVQSSISFFARVVSQRRQDRAAPQCMEMARPAFLGLQNGIRIPYLFGDNTNIFTESGPEVLPALTELLLQYISVFILFTFSDKSQGIDRI